MLAVLIQILMAQLHPSTQQLGLDPQTQQLQLPGLPDAVLRLIFIRLDRAGKLALWGTCRLAGGWQAGQAGQGADHTPRAEAAPWYLMLPYPDNSPTLTTPNRAMCACVLQHVDRSRLRLAAHTADVARAERCARLLAAPVVGSAASRAPALTVDMSGCSHSTIVAAMRALAPLGPCLTELTLVVSWVCALVCGRLSA